MWFKNLSIYRLPAPWVMTADKLAALLEPQRFKPIASNEVLTQGWEPPRGAGTPLVHALNGQLLLALRTESKVMPSAAVRAVVKLRADQLEEEQGFRPGKKAMKELTERATDEMLPRAFSLPNVVHVWIDTRNGWLGIDTAGVSRAGDVVRLLLKAVDKLPLESLRVNQSPAAVMTGWLGMDEAPRNFTIDQDATLRAAGESKSQVGYKRHSLDGADVLNHIAAGKQCTRLAMTWNSRISFVLTEQLAIKSIKPLDVMKEGASTAIGSDERFDSDFVLMTGELAKMLADLVEALGGEAKA